MGEEGYTNHPPEVDLSRVKAGFFVPKLCNHCDNAPCVEVCPVDATYLTEDGAVLVDPEVCIGCGYCVQACPYGARYIYPENGPNERMRGIVDKCTWCYHRIQRGLEPACVMACPTKARLFGNLMDPDSVVRQYLNKVGIDVLRPELELRPKVYYYFANLI
jgi:Fe-S-cluster-containing dehydrogenase component